MHAMKKVQWKYRNRQIDGSAQDCSNYIADALDLLQPCSEPLKLHMKR